MTSDLSDYELRVLRQMVKGGDEDLICGAALWVAMESLERRGLVGPVIEKAGNKMNLSYDATEAGRALVRAREAELTETPNGHR
jgi:hypothetical protein